MGFGCLQLHAHAHEGMVENAFMGCFIEDVNQGRPSEICWAEIPQGSLLRVHKPGYTDAWVPKEKLMAYLLTIAPKKLVTVFWVSKRNGHQRKLVSCYGLKGKSLEQWRFLDPYGGDRLISLGAEDFEALDSESECEQPMTEAEFASCSIRRAAGNDD